MPYVLTCQRALRAYVIMCQRALFAHVFTCQRALRAYMLTCSRANVPCVPTCPRANVSLVSTCSRANMACVLCVPTCSHAITTNDKGKFSITCFAYKHVLVLIVLFCDCSLSFSCEIKTVAHFCVSLTSQKPLMGAMTNIVQWNGLIFVWA